MNFKPAIIIGRDGITPALLEEAARAFERNPVIKIRLLADDRPARRALVADFAAQTGATVCGELGHTATLFRQKALP